MAFPSRPLHYVAFILCWALLLASVSFAVAPENRALLPAGGATVTADRTPAQAGLESGRYREIPAEDVPRWEREQELHADAPAATGEKKPASATDPF